MTKTLVATGFELEGLAHQGELFATHVGPASRHHYDEEATGRKSPFWIEKFKPIQVAAFDLEEYQNGRVRFTTDQWIDLLVRSIGMEPSHFNCRLKLHLLLRLVPLCEANYNFIELGPRGTGKSYAYQELSPYTILLTGPTTVANLFYNMATNRMGLVGIWDAIAFDEVADLQKMPKEVVTTLKTFCESGAFARGKEALSGGASIAMFGNTNQPVEVVVRSSYSELKKQSVLPALLILGDLSIQGNIKPLRSLAEVLQVGMDNGARRALIPLENKRHFVDVSADIMERVDPIFYGDPMTAALKCLRMN